MVQKHQSAQYFRHYAGKKLAFIKYKKAGVKLISEICQQDLKQRHQQSRQLSPAIKAYELEIQPQIIQQSQRQQTQSRKLTYRSNRIIQEQRISDDPEYEDKRKSSKLKGNVQFIDIEPSYQKPAFSRNRLEGANKTLFLPKLEQEQIEHTQRVDRSQDFKKGESIIIQANHQSAIEMQNILSSDIEPSFYQSSKRPQLPINDHDQLSSASTRTRTILKALGTLPLKQFADSNENFLTMLNPHPQTTRNNQLRYLQKSMDNASSKQRNPALEGNPNRFQMRRNKNLLNLNGSAISTQDEALISSISKPKETERELLNFKSTTKSKQKDIVAQCKHIMDTQEDPHPSLKVPLSSRNLPMLMYLEDQKSERFHRTLDIVRELESYEPHQLKQLFNYKLTGIMEEEQEARNVSYEYRIGMMDPSREAAMREKQKNARQIVIGQVVVVRSPIYDVRVASCSFHDGGKKVQSVNIQVLKIQRCQIISGTLAGIQHLASNQRRRRVRSHECPYSRKLIIVNKNKAKAAVKTF